MRNIILVLLLLFIPSCDEKDMYVLSTPPIEMIKQLRNGMTPERVVELIGTPNNVSQATIYQDNFMRFEYQVQAQTNGIIHVALLYIFFRNDYVIQIGTYPDLEEEYINNNPELDIKRGLFERNNI